MARLTFKKVRAILTQEIPLDVDIAEQVPDTAGIILITVGNRVEVCDSAIDLRSLVQRSIDNLRYNLAYTPRVFIASTSISDSSEIHSALLVNKIMSLVLPQSEICRDYSKYR